MKVTLIGDKPTTITPEPKTAKLRRINRPDQPAMKTCGKCGRVYPLRALMTFKFKGVKVPLSVCHNDAMLDRKVLEGKGVAMPGAKRMRILAKKSRAYDRKMRR